MPLIVIACSVAINPALGFKVVNSTSKRYTLKSLSGDFVGLQLVCYLYVAFQIIAPGTDVGFDLSHEYQIALGR